MKLQKIEHNGKLIGFNLVPETDGEKDLLLEYERINNRSDNPPEERIIPVGVKLSPTTMQVESCTFEKLKYGICYHHNPFQRMNDEKEFVITDVK